MNLQSHAIDTTYSESKNQFLFVVSYAEYCLLILSVINLHFTIWGVDGSPFNQYKYSNL